eukprot:8109626-Ditylum_brightwellii.AAC.1
MIKDKVWQPIKLCDVPKGAKILTSTWACKLKSNGRKRARLNGRGYEQIDGLHYDSTSIHAPVTNKSSVCIVLVLVLMVDWIGRINDTKGAFLKGGLDQKKEQIYMGVPGGFEKYYPPDM